LWSREKKSSYTNSHASKQASIEDHASDAVYKDDSELLALVLDQLGDDIMSIKQRFDIVGSSNITPDGTGTGVGAGAGSPQVQDLYITKEQVIGLCLDLGLRSSLLADVAAESEILVSNKVEDMEAGAYGAIESARVLNEGEDKWPCIPFSEFMLMYGRQYSKDQQQTALGKGSMLGSAAVDASGNVAVNSKSYRYQDMNDNELDEAYNRVLARHTPLTKTDGTANMDLVSGNAKLDDVSESKLKRYL